MALVLKKGDTCTCSAHTNAFVLMSPKPPAKPSHPHPTPPTPLQPSSDWGVSHLKHDCIPLLPSPAIPIPTWVHPDSLPPAAASWTCWTGA